MHIFMYMNYYPILHYNVLSISQVELLPSPKLIQLNLDLFYYQLILLSGVFKFIVTLIPA